MKKPNVLNRSMFNRGGTSAYGKGITSNLVSDEQRQGYNYGGRVGLFVGGTGYGRSQNPFEPNPYGVGTTVPELDLLRYQQIPPERISGADLMNFVQKNPKYGNLRFANSLIPSQLYSPTSSIGDEREDYRDVTDTPEFRKLYQDYIDPETTLIDPDKIDVKTGLPIEEDIEDAPFIEEEKEVVEEPGYERGEHWEDLASKMPGDAIKEVVRDDTDQLDTSDKWAFLDAYEAKKKKQAKGQAAWEGAATALDWGFAGTPEAKAAAVSKGLRKVGGIGAKYTGEAEDLRAKAEILGALEEEKQKGKIDVQTMKETGLGERHKNLIAHYKSLQDDPDKTQFDIYKTLIQTAEGTTGVRMGKVLRAMAEGKRPVADAFDFTNKEQLNKIKDGTIVVSLEGVTGIKDSNEEDGIKEVSIEEILKSLE